MRIFILQATFLCCMGLSCSGATARCTGESAANPPNVLGTDAGIPKTVEVDDNGSVRKLDYIKMGNKAVFEGDIVIGDAEQIEFAAQSGPIRLYRQSDEGSEITPFGYVSRSVLSGATKWTNNTVPYAIDPELPNANDVGAAMKMWSDISKIKFVERTLANKSKYPNYVYITIGSDPNACLAHGVGMGGGKQLIELVTGCGVGQIAHELGHILGLDHEQNRSDRDKFVQVKISNIKAGYAGQFSKRPSVYKDFGSYDFDTIMHYEVNAFSCNGEDTIVPIVEVPNGARIGQRDHISAGDVAVINAIYK